MARSLSVLLVLLLGLNVVACGGESGGDGQATATKPALRYQFAAGTTYDYVSTFEMKSEGGMMNMSQQQEQKLSWSVREVDDQGVATIDVTYESVKGRMESPQGVMEFDSTKDGDAADPFGQATGAFVGKTVTMKVDARGKLHDVEGFDAIMESALKDNPAAAFMKSTFSDEAMTQTMQNSMAQLPESTPAVGDEWAQAFAMPLGMMGTMSMDLTNKLEAIDDVGGAKIAKIKIVGTFDKTAMEAPKDTGDDPMAAMMSQTKISDGKVAGELHFDMTNGRVEAQRQSVSMGMDMMGQQMIQTTTTTMKRVD